MMIYSYLVTLSATVKTLIIINYHPSNFNLKSMAKTSLLCYYDNSDKLKICNLDNSYKWTWLVVNIINKSTIDRRIRWINEIETSGINFLDNYDIVEKKRRCWKRRRYCFARSPKIFRWYTRTICSWQQLRKII